MSEYSEENQGSPINYDDSGQMQTTDTVRAMQGDDDDMPGPGLDVQGKIHLQLCSISEKIDQSFQTAQAKEQARLASIPRRIDLHPNTTKAGTAFQVLNFGGPQLGRQWSIRNAVAVDISSALAIGQAVLCVGPPASLALIDPANGFNTTGAASVVKAPLTVNLNVAAAGFSVGQIPVHSNEIAFLVCKPNAAADIVMANITVEDEPVAALTEVTGEV